MWEFIEANKRKTTFLLILLTLFLMAAGSVMGLYAAESVDGVLVGLIISIICTIGIIIYSKFNASKFFLNQADAVEIKKGDVPILENIVEEMSIASNLGFVPKIFIINSPCPNAFAVGINKNNAAIAVTTSLLTLLNRDELTGVIAHETSHIKNQDTLYLMYAGVIFGIIVSISDALLRSNTRRTRRSSKGNGEAIILLIVILFAILSPIMARLLYFSLSRKREFLADACACQYTRYPTGLASALYKISNYSIGGDKHSPDGSNDLVRCMYIHNRLQKEESAFSNLFSTHPPVDKRIEVLKKMGAADIKEYNKIYSTVVMKKQLISKKVLSKMNITPLVITSAALEAEQRKTKRQREIKNAFYDSKNYKIIKCDCETILKIPPELNIKTITCPHCKKEHGLLEIN